MTEIAKAYDPTGVEERWYTFWRDQGFFHGRTGAEGEPFCIVIPPPNVTGILHMGHALNNTLQDVLVRRARMQGRPTMWLPGTDHAGIATQNVVERRLAEDGKTRHDLGREAFVERTWEWKDTYEARILGQLARLGCSLDWDRRRFTMDDSLSYAVRLVFVRLFEEGLIYRGHRIINWCPRCTTALSDIEVEYADRDGELITMRYPLASGGGHISVATTRVETMLGDTAVAVHPDDDRYRSLVGQMVSLPLTDREIPMIADEAVDPEFGTGAVKVTPAHDPNDFEISQRHDIGAVNIFGPTAVVNEHGGRFAGLDRFEAREQVLVALRDGGLVEAEERPYVHSVGHCERCKTVVEPWLSDQWFVSMQRLAAPAIEAVREGRIQIHPERPFKKTYFDWMQNIRDWCISRQLWWGHRIPVWYCSDGHVFAALEDPEECAECGTGDLKQDPDVLDTWFSSWLWPFSTLGWPQESEDLSYWYPTSVLLTGYDILFFWVARMIMAGLHFRAEVPFRDVVLTGLVRDWEGKKMSKSTGTAMDPIDLVERYGTDAVRFTLVRAANPGQDMNLNEDWIEGSRHFCNKLWNAARFVLSNLDGEPGPPSDHDLGLADRWILSRLAQTRESVDASLGAFEFSEAARTLHQFIWSEFCDWYLEMAKLGLRDPVRAPGTRSVLDQVLQTSLRLAHPVMPFITEELWQRLPRRDGDPAALIVAAWPQARVSWIDAEAEEDMAFLQELVVELRRFRHDHGIAPQRRIDVVIHAAGRFAALLEVHAAELQALAWLAEVRLGDRPGEGWSRIVAGQAEAFVRLGEYVDIASEQTRLSKEIGNLEDAVQANRRKLDNPRFVEGAPEDVVAKTRRAVSEAGEKLARLRAQLEELA